MNFDNVGLTSKILTNWISLTLHSYKVVAGAKFLTKIVNIFLIKILCQTVANTAQVSTSMYPECSIREYLF